MSITVSQNIITILEALNFNAYLAKRHPNVTITCKDFEKLQPNSFRILFYYLFGKLNPEKTKDKFRSVYPSRDSRQEAEFRQITIEMLKEINSKDPNCKFGSILPIHFQRLSGQPFVELVYRFANYVLSKAVVQKTKVFANSSPEKLLGAWSSTAELQTKTMEYDANLLQYDAQCEQFIKQMNNAVAQIAAKREVVENQFDKYEPYRDAVFLEKNNQYLEQQVAELGKFIENATSKLNASTNDSLSSIGTRDKLLITELETVDQLAKFIKRNHEQLLNTLKVTTELQSSFQRQQAKLDCVSKIIDSLRENLAQAKGELFQTEQAKAELKKVKTYFKPLFETPLTFEAYSPGLHQRIDAFLTRMTDRVRNIEPVV